MNDNDRIAEARDTAIEIHFMEHVERSGEIPILYEKCFFAEDYR